MLGRLGVVEGILVSSSKPGLRAAGFLACLVLLACKGPEEPQLKGAGEAAQETELVVFAATSLREPFTSLGESWRTAHPGATLTFNFAGTQELRMQLEQGAAADVFASADPRHMDELVKGNRASAPTWFARNEPVIVVAKEAAESIRALGDLPRAKRLVIGAPEVPIGRYTLQVLDKAAGSLGATFRADVESKVVSRELNVRQVLNKVKLGEAEAGFVYRTDALSAPELRVISIPAELNVIAEYPIAAITDAKHPKLAQSFVELVKSREGLSALEHAGFLASDAAAQ
jgi:molybdate transport system substrate-binding protein